MLSFFLTIFAFIVHLWPSPTTSQIPDSDHTLEGEWRLLQQSIGISAMHMQLLRNDRVVMFDRTDFGRSNLSLPGGKCRFDPTEAVLQVDCTAHSILYDIKTNYLRALTVQTDTWCSSGAVLTDGTLVQTGGFNDGDHVVRTLAPCGGDNCDWMEIPGYLSRRRWYASNHILPDGRVIIVGGRGQFSYEFFPQTVPSTFVELNFLRETTDAYENNLYPFLHLLPDGNLFVFANTRSVVLDYKANRIIREFPTLPGGDPRNYPSSGSSVLLPLDESSPVIAVEVMICGGATRNAARFAAEGTFQRAVSTCGRLKISDQEPAWKMENMPIPRVMGDMVLLPDGNVLIINGAGSGTAGWEAARNPVTTPLIYKPYCETNSGRFSVMAPAARPRMYHSSAVLIPDGRVLIGGSNPHIYYNFTGVEYPTDLSLEAFSPPYLSVLQDPLRPSIVEFQSYGIDNNAMIVGYNRDFSLTFTVERFMTLGIVSVRIVAPSFNTHSFSMNQRMVVLKGVRVWWETGGVYRVVAVGPSTAEIAPPGYYLLYVVHAGIPSCGKWVKIQ